MNYKKIYFIINPNSGKKKGQEFYDYLLEHNESNYTILLTSKEKEATELAKNALKNRADMVVSCGGDGTFNEVASALVHSGVPLGIIPIGSGNGLARQLGIPLDYKKAFQNLWTYQPFVIDVGKINELYFFSNAGIGLDAEIISDFSSQKKRGLIAYAKSSFYKTFSYQPVHLKLTSQKTNFEGFIQLLNFANCNQIGYDFSFSPKSELDDGELNMLLVKSLHLLQVPFFSSYFLLKKLPHFPKSLSEEGKKWSIEILDNTHFIQIDGESVQISSKLLEVSVLPKALTVLC